MTEPEVEPPLPMPRTGGSFIRQPDGSLVQVEGAEPAPAPQPAPPPEPTPRADDELETP
jgi:hypothetical protein